jgi:hypothetical protein
MSTDIRSPFVNGDPDTFVAWTRTEEPGENPRWESQCGYIEQVGYGDNPIFQGFYGPNKIQIASVPTLSVAKRLVIKNFQAKHQLKWGYDTKMVLELNNKPIPEPDICSILEAD